MSAPLTFGVFPLGVAGAPGGYATGPGDDFDAIGRALTDLQGDGPPLVPRMYVAWTGREDRDVHDRVAELTVGGIRWDLVLSYRPAGSDPAGYADFVHQVVAEHGHELASVQVTGEANLTGLPFAADGDAPGVVEALVRGVSAAGAAKRGHGHRVAVGFAVVPDGEPGRKGFWDELAECADAGFFEALDYAGIDLYPDVFGGPVALADLPEVVTARLRDFRTTLRAAGVPDRVSLRVCENGWPTGPDRPEERQAEVLETVVRTVHGLRDTLGVTHWQLFALRDADSAGPSPFHRFGILRDDYTPKPAYHRLKRLIAELRD